MGKGLERLEIVTAYDSILFVTINSVDFIFLPCLCHRLLSEEGYEEDKTLPLLTK